jgi:F0F1-type ATP synthase membrane subunit c/vacuolar-type H+-ATPase subunit K
MTWELVGAGLAVWFAGAVFIALALGRIFAASCNDSARSASADGGRTRLARVASPAGRLR